VNLLPLLKIQRVTLIIGEHALARAPRRVMHVAFDYTLFDPVATASVHMDSLPMRWGQQDSCSDSATTLRGTFVATLR
jgi:hypothetical protein